MGINGVSILDKVINSCQSSASYLNNGKGDLEVSTVLLCPKGDYIAQKWGQKIEIREGSEFDVLSRYTGLLEATNADWVVRITADCPMIPAALITKHILIASKHSFDYVSNVYEQIRTAPDGHDVEVISKKLLEWAKSNVKTDKHREHVTLVLRECPPAWAKYANVVGYCDESHLKLSVDTEEDLQFVRTYDKILHDKIRVAKKLGQGFFRW